MSIAVAAERPVRLAPRNHPIEDTQENQAAYHRAFQTFADWVMRGKLPLVPGPALIDPGTERIVKLIANMDRNNHAQA